MTLITKTQKLWSSVGGSVTSKKFRCISGDDEYLGMDEDTCTIVTARRELKFNEVEPNDSSNMEDLSIDHTQASSEEIIPKINMEFESEDAAYNFYNEYARVTGFSILKAHCS
ncbi:hypothetical protein ACS0TY_023826 [Phlomoides rotata]